MKAVVLLVGIDSFIKAVRQQNICTSQKRAFYRLPCLPCVFSMLVVQNTSVPLFTDGIAKFEIKDLMV